MLQKGKGSLRRIDTPVRARSSQASAWLLRAFSVLQRNVSKSVLPRIGVVLAITSVIALGSTLFGRLPQAQAATSQTITFQGRLLTSTGTTVPDGSYNMQFNLYTVASGGSTQWTDSRLVNATQGITLKNGYFSVNLADTSVGGTAFPSTINWDQEQWLGLTVRGTNSCTPFSSCATPADAEMTPRFKLTAVPYAFSAGQLQQTNGASTLKVVTTAPTANVTYTFQDATAGTYNVCTSANNCTGLGAYIQNGTAAQNSANFNIQSAATGSVTAKFRLIGSQTADVLQVRDSGDTTSLFSIGATGAALFKNSANSTTAFQVQNAAGTNLFTADTTNQRISIGLIGTATGQLYVAGSLPSVAAGSVATSNQTNGLDVQGRYAYVVSSTANTLQIYDVTNVGSPVSRGFGCDR